MTPLVHIRRWHGWWRADTYAQDGAALRLDAVTLGTAADAQGAAVFAFRSVGIELGSDSLDVLYELGNDGERYMFVESEHRSGTFPSEKVAHRDFERPRQANDMRRR